MLTSILSFSLMFFHAICYLNSALIRLENYPEFSRFFFCGQQYRLENTKRNASDISDFRNQVHHRIGSRCQIHFDRHSNYSYISFGSSQPPISIKEQLLLPYFPRESLTNQNNTFLGLFYCRFLLP